MELKIPTSFDVRFNKINSRIVAITKCDVNLDLHLWHAEWTWIPFHVLVSLIRMDCRQLYAGSCGPQIWSSLHLVSTYKPHTRWSNGMKWTIVSWGSYQGIIQIIDININIGGGIPATTWSSHCDWETCAICYHHSHTTFSGYKIQPSPRQVWIQSHCQCRMISCHLCHLPFQTQFQIDIACRRMSQCGDSIMEQEIMSSQSPSILFKAWEFCVDSPHNKYSSSVERIIIEMKYISRSL